MMLLLADGVRIVNAPTRQVATYPFDLFLFRFEYEKLIDSDSYIIPIPWHCRSN